jgi:hypothetical protein
VSWARSRYGCGRGLKLSVVPRVCALRRAGLLACEQVGHGRLEPGDARRIVLNMTTIYSLGTLLLVSRFIVCACDTLGVGEPRPTQRVPTAQQQAKPT